MFYLYNIVRIKSSPELGLYSIRDSDDYDEEKQVHTLLSMMDGTIIRVHEDDLEPTGEYEAPIKYNQVVVINNNRIDEESTEPTKLTLVGTQGIVTGIAYDDNRATWCYSVMAFDDQNWFFLVDELEPTGEVIPICDVGPEDYCRLINEFFEPYRRVNGKFDLENSKDKYE